MYKHPVIQTRDFNKNILETIFDMINREGKRLVLLGDFNTNLLAYKENKEVREFVDILQNNLITPSINLPTRITAQSSTIIDNILLSSFDSKIYTGNLLVGLSDHCPQLAIISNENERKENTKLSVCLQDWKKFDESKFKSAFRSIDWDKIIDQENSDLAFRRFHRKVLELIDENVPRIILTKKQQKREHKPWITKEIRKMICTRDKMFLKFQKEKSPCSEVIFFKNTKIITIAWLKLLETVKTSSIFAILMRT